MCKVTISAFQMIQKFPDNESARLHIERIRWNGKPVCPRCNSSEKQYAQNRKYEPGYYICATCEKTYTVRTGTIFERSHVDLHKWLFAIYLVCTARKGISSLQLSKEIGVTQKTAWFMLQRIRQACEDDNGNDDGNPDGFLKGVVEVDEVYVGGLESNKHESKKQPEGCRYRDKAVVLGIKERDGKVMAKHVPSSKSKDVRPIIRKSVAEGSTLCTDEFCVYADMHKWYDHKTVQHSAKQYVDGKAHTNGIESVWAVLKRAFYGIYHSFSFKHLQRYLNEVCFRLNSGNVTVHTLNRISSFLRMCNGKRLTWKECVA